MAGNITDNGAFIYNSTAAQTLSAVISGSGTLTQNGSGALTISGTGNSYTGITTVNSSYLSIARDLSLGAVPTSSFSGWNGTCVPNQLTLNCGSTANVGIRWTASGQLPLNAARGVYLTAGSHNGYIGSSSGSIADQRKPHQRAWQLPERRRLQQPPSAPTFSPASAPTLARPQLPAAG